MKSTELDIETTGLSPWKDKMVSIQLGDRYYDLYPKDVIKIPDDIRAVLEDPNIEKIMHNAHFEYIWFLIKAGIRIQNFQDSQLAAFLTWTKAKVVKETMTRYSVALKPLSMHLFNADASEFQEFDKHGGIVGVTRYLFNAEDLKRPKGVTKEALYEKFKSYSLKDNVFSRQVWEHCKKNPEWNNVQRVYDNEIKLIPVLCDMEAAGMQCDRDAVMERIEEVKVMITRHEKNLYHMVGQEFDLRGREVGDILREKCGVPLDAISKDGHYRCDSKYTLPKFMNHEVVRELVVYRKLAWTLSTCLKRWASDSADGSPVRTKINAMGAVHGRLSASDPNLMNVPNHGPSKDELSKMDDHIAKSYERVADLRKFFVPRPGFTFYMFDWSQIELVLAAFYSKDEAYLKAFKNNEDAHRKTAADALGISLDQVTEEQRSNYKEDGFGILYGSGVKAIAERIVNKQGIPYNEAYPLAQIRYKGYFNAHPGIRKCNNDIKDVLLTDEEQRADHERLQANQKRKGGKTWDFRHCRKMAYRGYLRNLYGRIWYPDNPGQHYKGLEAIVSGTATGDMLKIAMVKIHELLQNYKTRLLLPVHDELIIEMKNGEEQKLVPKIKAIMEDYPEVTKTVPVRVDIERSTKNWKEKELVYDSKKGKWIAEDFANEPGNKEVE